MVRGEAVPDLRVFDGATAAVALLAGPERRLIYTNAAFARLFGDHRIGWPAAEAFPDPDGRRFPDFLDAVRVSGCERLSEGTYDTQPRGGERARHFVYSCSPVAVGREGTGILVVAMDTTQATDALQRYEALASAVSQTLWLMRPDGTMREILPGWERLTGTPWRSRADSGWSEVIHPRDLANVGEAWRAAAEADPPEVFECTFRTRTTSGYRHMFSRAVPVLHEGRIVEWISATSDVEDTWRARLRESLLTAIAGGTDTAHGTADTGTGSGPGSGTALSRAFQAVANAIVPELADACLILTLTQPEWPLPEPEAPTEARTATRLATAVRTGLPQPPPLRGRNLPLSPALREALDRRAPQTVTFPAGAVPPHLVPAATAHWLAAVGATSLTLLPLIVADAVYGYAVTVTCGDSPPPGKDDTDLLHEVLHHAQQPIRILLDHQQARRTALDLQRAHLTALPDIPGAELAARYQPSSTTTEIGGDWYDAFTLPDRTLVLDIGDVAGHDITAATAMGQLRSMLRALAYTCGPTSQPGEVLVQLDTVADGLARAPFTTAVHAHLTPRPDRTWHLAWSNAGHPPPLLVPAHGPTRYLTGAGGDLPLCVDTGAPRTTHHHELHPGDTLLLYTDGLIETPTTSLTDGQDRLARSAAGHRHLPLADLLGRLQELSDHRDDTALVAFRAGTPPA
ncbi:SpoIIE family protein phosphatase [Kitasatospora sp. NBC_01539]|uniref:SpoIIE family protein phosphatase n=1 Tax=Kitasatospora sp. NBC_01539 TaxID=2903577 RepID=UPI00386011F5